MHGDYELQEGDLDVDEQGDDASIMSRVEGAEEGEEVDENDEDDADFDPVADWHPNNPYQVRTDLPNILSEQLF